MRIRTPRELGAVLRNQRRALAWSQVALSEKARVSRKWIVEMEKGKARAELTLVLRVLDALGLVLRVDPATQPEKKGGTRGIDIDAIVAAARKGKP
jgi:HTH-type transcriptional regulator / antitoxin HipB